MNPTIGISRQKTSSSSIDAAPIALIVLILVGSGASLRIGSHLHLHLPGHQGLIRIATMMLAARLCRLPWAASIMASGAGIVAAVLPTHGFDPTGPLAYVLSGLVIDIGDRLAPRWRTNLASMALVGAAANATKPLALCSSRRRARPSSIRSRTDSIIRCSRTLLSAAVPTSAPGCSARVSSWHGDGDAGARCRPGMAAQISSDRPPRPRLHVWGNV